ncbi:MAG: hypothetical protein EA350_09085 [Gemmatimonadales bacterium]|nr:MAG: hypothetical protein EA350_09085 [Gemmatimonadales bacterium]
MGFPVRILPFRLPVKNSSSSSASSGSRASRSRIDARVALALLETLQREDLPEEVLVDENLSITLPRRLGLSHVIHSQVRRYREEVRHNRRVPEAEVVDLIRLVARRPDAARVFREVGRALGSDIRPGWRRVLPRRLALGSSRRRAGKLLRSLFGRGVVRLPRGEPRIVAGSDLLHSADPSGSACVMVTGIVEGVVGASTRIPLRVRQVGCSGKGDPACAWEIEEQRPELVQAAAAESEPEVGGQVESPDPLPSDDGEALSA